MECDAMHCLFNKKKRNEMKCNGTEEKPAHPSGPRALTRITMINKRKPTTHETKNGCLFVRCRRLIRGEWVRVFSTVSGRRTEWNRTEIVAGASERRAKMTAHPELEASRELVTYVRTTKIFMP
jgi:hypothetical protein